jgi:hypothetical protein
MSHPTNPTEGEEEREAPTSVVLPGAVQLALARYRTAQYAYGRRSVSITDDDLGDAGAEFRELEQAIAAALAHQSSAVGTKVIVPGFRFRPRTGDQDWVVESVRDDVVTFRIVGMTTTKPLSMTLKAFEEIVAVAPAPVASVLAALPDDLLGRKEVQILVDAARELFAYTSYAEIAGGIRINRSEIRMWCDTTLLAIQAVEDLASTSSP